MRIATRHVRPKPVTGVDSGRPWEGRMPTSAPGERIRPRKRQHRSLMFGLSRCGSRAPIAFS
jgi:hypothetical protein